MSASKQGIRTGRDDTGRLDTALRRVLHGRPQVGDRRLAKAVAGKTVLVTGASSGIGSHVARRLGAAGAHVVLTGRSAGRLDRLAGEIRAVGGRASWYAADLTDPRQTADLVDWVHSECGGVDSLVNNAGQSLWRSFALTDYRPDDAERMTAVNYLGPVRLTLGLLPAMRERAESSVVSVSSIAVLLPTLPRMAAYVAAKSAFDAWLRGLATEVRGDGVRVSTVYLSVTRTRMTAATPWMRLLRPLGPRDAAGMVCDALVRRRRNSGPWWRWLLTFGHVPFAGVEALLARLYARSADTPAARLVCRQQR